MLLVSTDRLTPGVAVALAVPHPQRSHTCLIQANMELSELLIKRLQDLGLQSVWVKHGLLNDLAQRINTTIPERRRDIYNSIAKGFDELQSRVITTDDHAHYCDVISELITALLEGTSQIGVLAERLFTDGDELVLHCANVAYMAVTVGMHLESYILHQRGNKSASGLHELCHMGVGAILHDIGKLSMDKAARGRHSTTDKNDDAYAAHVVDGFQMLRNRVNVLAGTVALHHHQRWDGQGWPDMTKMTHGRFVGGMAGRDIHIFARIVAVANIFDQLTAGAGGAAMPAIYALHRMQSNEYAGAFDPVVLNAFQRYVPPFPVGVQVILNDGRPAAVVDLNTDHPCRPIVRPIDEQATGENYNLLEHPELSIQESQGHKVGPWLYEVPTMAKALAAAGA